MELYQRNWKNFQHLAKGAQENRIALQIGLNIANHARTNYHTKDFNNEKVIDKGNFRHRWTPESWHTTFTKGSGNNSKYLPQRRR